MALNLETLFAGKINPGSAAYPYGSFRDVTVPADGTGTPYVASYHNDIYGLLQRLLTEGGQTPSGDPDTVLDSQYYSALESVIRGNGKHPDLTDLVDFATEGRMKENSFAATLGYTTAGDGGNNSYQFKDAGNAGARPAEDGGKYIHVPGGSGGRYLEGLFPDGVYSVRKFGAIGNDETDDTAALQSIVNFMTTIEEIRSRVIFLPGGMYLFDALTIPAEATGLAFAGLDFWACNLRCTANNENPAILCRAQEAKLQNMSVISAFDYADNRATGKAGIKFDKGTGETADVDASIRDCRISGWDNGIDFLGRGLKVLDSIMSVNHNSINLNWPDPADYVEGAQTAQKDLTGFRGILIKNNRFHSHANAAIANTGDNKHKINSLHVLGNTLDVGRVLIDGHLGRNGLVMNNIVDQTPNAALKLSGGHNCLVTGLVASGDPIEGRIGDNLIHVTSDDFTNCMMTDLVLSHCKQHAIYIEGGTCDGIVLKNIQFNDVCTDGGAYRPITITAQNSQLTVEDIFYNGSLTLESVINNGFSNNVVEVSNVKVNGNNTPKTTGSVKMDGVKVNWAAELADASSGGNISPSSAAGAFYIKNGEQITLYVSYEDIDTTGMTGGNDLFIRNLPFPARTVTGTAFYLGNVSGSVIDHAGQIAPVILDGQQVMRLQELQSGAGYDYVTVSQITSGVTDMYLQITYPI